MNLKIEFLCLQVNMGSMIASPLIRIASQHRRIIQAIVKQRRRQLADAGKEGAKE